MPKTWIVAHGRRVDSLDNLGIKLRHVDDLAMQTANAKETPARGPVVNPQEDTGRLVSECAIGWWLRRGENTRDGGSPTPTRKSRVAASATISTYFAEYRCTSIYPHLPKTEVTAP
jgi:hypothetical protein